MGHFHFTDGETGTERLMTKWLDQLTQLVSVELEFEPGRVATNTCNSYIFFS